MMPRWIGLAVALAALSSSAHAQEPIVLFWHERPPYYHQEGDALVGIDVEPTEAAFTAAGIPFRWQDLPAKRQLAVIRDNAVAACSPGWFRDPERERFALFSSRPLYRDRANVVLARAGDLRVARHTTLRGLLGDPALGIVTKVGYSYGAAIDTLLAQATPHRQNVASENLTMARMIAGGHADYMILSPEEGNVLIRSLGAAGQALVLLNGIRDMPAGNQRWLMCSRAVGQDLVDRVSRAIRVPPAPPGEP